MDFSVAEKVNHFVPRCPIRGMARSNATLTIGTTATTLAPSALFTARRIMSWKEPPRPPATRRESGLRDKYPNASGLIPNS